MSAGTLAAVPMDELRVTVAGESLTYGEIALLICASGMPTDRPVWAYAEDAVGYVAEGLARLGRTGLAARLAENVALVAAKYGAADRQARRTASVAHQALWGGRVRFGRAHVLAERVWRSFAAAGLVQGVAAVRAGAA